jgi:hemolysin III
MARSGWRGSIVVYGIGLVLLYAVSSAYHLLPVREKARRELRRADHAMIYLFIAAAYGPFCLYIAPGILSDVVLGVVWLGALAGVGLTLAGVERTRYVAGPLYLVVGWLAVISLPKAFSTLAWPELALLGAMALFYTSGTLVLNRRWPDPAPRTFGYHEVWHSMVIVATACYYAVIWSVVGGLR